MPKVTHEPEKITVSPEDYRGAGGFDRAHRIVVALAAMSFAWKLFAILGGKLQSGPADMSQRILMANHFSQDWPNFFRDHFLFMIWPPGQFLTLGAVFEGLRFLEYEDKIHYVALSQIVGSLFFAASTIPVYALARRCAGPVAGVYAAIIFLGYITPNVFSYTGFAETYGLPFALLGLLSFLRYLQEGRGMWLGALLLLVASMYHGAVILLYPVPVLFLLFRRQWFRAVGFGAVSSAYWATDFLLTSVFRPNAYSYLTYRRFVGEGYFTGMWSSFTKQFELGLLDNYQWFLCYWGLIFGVALTFSKRYRFVALMFFFSFCSVVGLSFAKRLSFDDRNLYQAAVLFIPVLAISIHLPIALVYRGVPLLKKPLVAVAAACLCAISFNNIVRAHTLEGVHPARMRAVPEEVIEARDWLRANLGEDDSVSIDHLVGWAAYLHAWTDRVDVMRHSASYAKFPPLKKSPRPADLNRAERISYSFLDHLVDYEPRYVVIAGEPYYRFILSQTYHNEHRRHSYLRPHMANLELGSGDTRIGLVAEHRGVAAVLREALSNDSVMVLEVESILPINNLSAAPKNFKLRQVRIQLARPKKAVVLAPEDTALQFDIWYAAYDDLPVHALFNGEKVTGNHVYRGDLRREDHYPGYLMHRRVDWRIPIDQLRPQNTMEILIDDSLVFEQSLAVSQETSVSGDSVN